MSRLPMAFSNRAGAGCSTRKQELLLAKPACLFFPYRSGHHQSCPLEREILLLYFLFSHRFLLIKVTSNYSTSVLFSV